MKIIEYKEREIVFIYEKYIPVGINSFRYERREYRTRVDDHFVTVNDALKSFKEFYLGKLDRFVEVAY